jgi:hypothetical protein
MVQKKYDSVDILIPRRQRLLRMILPLVCCILGLFIIVADLTQHGSEYTISIIGGVVFFLSAYVLLSTWKETHETKLTAKGDEEKARDERIATEKAKQHEAAFITFLVTTSVMAYCVYSIETISEHIQGKSRVYSIYCEDWQANARECHLNRWSSGPIVEYSVHADQQSVVGSSPDEDQLPFRLFNCVVVDRLNWSCTSDTSKDSAQVAMLKGNYSSEKTAMRRPDIKFVPRYEWWLLHIF